MTNLIDLYSRLISFRKNLPEKPSFGIEEIYVNEYHDIVSLLEKETGTSLSQFKIDNSNIKPRLVSSSYISKEKKYSSTRYCDKSMLCMKVDALIMKFQLQSKGVEVEMGFGVDD